MLTYQTINWWAWFLRPSTVWNDIIEGVFAVSFTLRFQNAQILKILANRSWLNELCTANREIIWSFKISFQVKRQIGPVLDVKAPNPKKIMEMMQFTLRKQIENQKKHANYKSLSPKGYTIWMDFSHSTFKQSKLAGKTQPSQEILTHTKPLCYTAITVGNLNVTHQEDASESMMCFRSQEPHTPNLSPSTTLKKKVSEPSGRYGRFIECSSHETEYLSSMTPNQSQRLKPILYVAIMFAFVSADILFLLCNFTVLTRRWSLLKAQAVWKALYQVRHLCYVQNRGWYWAHFGLTGHGVGKFGGRKTPEENA